MFCSRCGYKLNDDAFFCQHCGVKVRAKDLSNAYVKKRTSSMEFNREALKIYLNDVLSLECIKNKYITEYQESERLIQHTKKENLKWRCEVFDSSPFGNSLKYCIHFYYNGETFYIAYAPRGDHHGDCVYTKNDFYGTPGEDWVWLEIDHNMNYLMKQYSWRQVTYPEIGRFQALDWRNDAKNRFLRAYEEFREKAPELYQANVKIIKKHIKKQEEIAQELQSLEKILKKEYDVNIIPETFRNNLYAIYYLYNFVSTSQESLSTALLHYDLNEIKLKLDTIIKQQQQIIINQAYIASQNKELMEQNKIKLNRLAAIEENTECAAKYATIAANNAEVCAWISFANYLNK